MCNSRVVQRQWCSEAQVCGERSKLWRLGGCARTGSPLACMPEADSRGEMPVPVAGLEATGAPQLLSRRVCGAAGVQLGCLDCRLGNQLASLRGHACGMRGLSGKQRRSMKKALQSVLADLVTAVSARQNDELAALLAELELAISLG